MANTGLWIIITDRSRPIRDVLRDLTDAGLVVSHVLEAMGGISGCADQQAGDTFRRVRGVQDIWLETLVSQRLARGHEVAP